MDLRDAASVNPRYAASDCSEFWDLKKVEGLAGSPENAAFVSRCKDFISYEHMLLSSVFSRQPDSPRLELMF